MRTASAGRHGRRATLGLPAVLVAPALPAATVWDEGLLGDLLTAAATPTTLLIAPGANVVRGSLQATGDTRD
jgi:hypothetical protein